MKSDQNPAEGYKIAVIDGEQLKIVELNGPNGPFEIAFAGMRPDGYMFFYRDGQQHFIFQTAEIDPKTDGRHIIIDSARTHKRSRSSAGVKVGTNFMTNSATEKILRQNIDFFFRTRHMIFTWQRIPTEEAPETVEFTWTIT